MKPTSALRNFLLACAFPAASFSFALSPAHAATLYWDGATPGGDAEGGAGTWDTASNWSTAAAGGSAVAWSNTTPDAAVFGGVGGLVTLGTVRSASGITFTSGGYVIRADSGKVLTIGAGGITQEATVGSQNNIGDASTPGYVTLSASQSWTNNSNQNLFQRDGNLVLGAHTLTFTSPGGGAIIAAGTTSGSGNIIVSANTAVSMSGTNSYSGTTTINSGAILTINSLKNFNAGSGLGTKSSNFASNLVIDGGTLRVQVESTTSNRLFTMGAGGATLEARLTGVNSGQILLNNTAALAYTGIGNRTLTLGGNSDDAGGSSISLAIGDVGGGNGTVALAKTEAHNWTVNGNNSYSGGTTVNAGTLTMGSATALGANTGSLTVNGGILNLNNNNLIVGNLTGTGGTIQSNTAGTRTLTIGNGDATGGDFEGVIANGTGTTAVTKVTNGTLTLSGDNTYTGATNINRGTLVINGSTAAGSAVNVLAPGTLAGTGTVGGATTVDGTHAPGGSIGKQTFSNNLTYSSASVFAWELTANESGRGTNYDAVNVAGTLGGSGAVFRAVLDSGSSFADAFWTTDRSWTDIFMNTAENASLDFASIFTSFEYWEGNTNVTPGIGSYGSFSITGSTLEWQAIPEPNTALAGLLLTAGLLRRRRC